MGLGTWGLGDVGTWGRGDSGTWGSGDSGTRGRGDVGTRGRGDAATHFRSIEFQKWDNIAKKVELLVFILLFKYQLNAERNSKIGFSKSHSRLPSQSSNVKQSRRPNGPLLTLQLKFHVAAFVVVVAQKLEPYDSFSVTGV